MSKSILWKSLKTGNEFSRDEYLNHGYGGIRKGLIDLPTDEYPYGLIYKSKSNINKEIDFLLWLKDYDAPNFLEWYLYNKIELNSLSGDLYNSHNICSIDEFDLITYKTYVNFMLGPVSAYLSKNGLTNEECPVISEPIRKLSILVAHTDIILFSTAASKIIPEVIKDPKKEPYDIIVELNLIQNNNEGEIEETVNSVIDKYPEKVAEYIKGKKNVANMFVGEVMRTKKGLSPKVVSEIIEKKLQKLLI